MASTGTVHRPLKLAHPPLPLSTADYLASPSTLPEICFVSRRCRSTIATGLRRPRQYR